MGATGQGLSPWTAHRKQADPSGCVFPGIYSPPWKLSPPELPSPAQSQPLLCSPHSSHDSVPTARSVTLPACHTVPEVRQTQDITQRPAGGAEVGHRACADPACTAPCVNLEGAAFLREVGPVMPTL